MSAADTTKLIAALLNTTTSSDEQLVRLRAEVDPDGRIVVDLTTFDFGVDSDLTERVLLFPSPAMPVTAQAESAPNGVGVIDQPAGGTA